MASPGNAPGIARECTWYRQGVRCSRREPQRAAGMRQGRALLLLLPEASATTEKPASHLKAGKDSRLKLLYHFEIIGEVCLNFGY
jgi:hypothetical protein